MSKYIPKLGDKVLSSGQEVKVLSIPDSNDCICVLCIGENLHWVVSLRDISPLPTKADVEREQLREIVQSIATSTMCADVIQKAGFTIPKKVKRSEILEVAKVDLFSEEAESFTDVICQLLGDLVESYL